jgi:hypothetical protein
MALVSPLPQLKMMGSPFVKSGPGRVSLDLLPWSKEAADPSMTVVLQSTKKNMDLQSWVSEYPSILCLVTYKLHLLHRI